MTDLLCLQESDPLRISDPPFTECRIYGKLVLRVDRDLAVTWIDPTFLASLRAYLLTDAGTEKSSTPTG